MRSEQTAFAERLRAALESAGIEPSPAALVKLLARQGANNVTPQAVSAWLGGKHLPKQENLRALADIVGMEPHLLAFGGPSFQGVRDEHTAWPDRVRAHDRLAFEAYLTLPEPQRKLVRELIDMLAERAPRRPR